MVSDKLLTDGLKGYLTPNASKLIETLVEGGMDRDLAVIFLEAHWPDTAIYQLEGEE